MTTHQRGVSLVAAKGNGEPQVHVRNLGTAVDVFRLSLDAEAGGWTVTLANALVAVEPGQQATAPIRFARTAGAPGPATVTVAAVSESHPTRKATATLIVSGR